MASNIEKLHLGYQALDTVYENGEGSAEWRGEPVLWRTEYERQDIPVARAKDHLDLQIADRISLRIRPELDEDGNVIGIVVTNRSSVSVTGLAVLPIQGNEVAIRPAGR